MIDATMEGGDGETRGLTDEDIVASSTSFLLAGYETTANTLAYASYLLALNPEIQEKLKAKIDEYFESNPVSTRDVLTLGHVWMTRKFPNWCAVCTTSQLIEC